MENKEASLKSQLILLVVGLSLMGGMLLWALGYSIFENNLQDDRHPLRYKKFNCDLSTINTTPTIERRITTIYSFLDDTLTDSEEVKINEIITASIEDSTLNNLIIQMHSAGILDNIFGRFNEEWYFINNRIRNKKSLVGYIKSKLHKYETAPEEIRKKMVLSNVFLYSDLSYDASQLFFNSYLNNDTTKFSISRSHLFDLMKEQESFYRNFSDGTLKLALEEFENYKFLDLSGGRSSTEYKKYHNSTLARVKSSIESHVKLREKERKRDLQ